MTAGATGGAASRGDEVDRIVRQWEAAVPRIDARALEVFSRISRIAHHLETVRRDAFASHGLDAWEFDVLSALRRAGAPYELTPGALMQDTLVTSGTITSRVEKLQARGLVTKSPAPGDGRSVVVRLSTDGIALVDRAIASLIGAEDALLAHLPEGADRALASSLRALLIGIEAPAPRP